MNITIHKGDCFDIMKEMSDGSVQLIYLDPPFFTQKVHSLRTRDRQQKFSFRDIWTSNVEYTEFLRIRLMQMRRVLSDNGSIFFHCDKNSSHIARVLLDAVFGEDMFRNEIIWHYRRWSNAAATFLPSHQTIYYYTKSNEYTFNPIYQDYSSSTNVDQILQRRKRDEYGKSVYERNKAGDTIPSGGKKGVPLFDVWDIPYLNPKAKERVGYPTQKPLLLLERIVRVSTKEGDVVLDPFCGSGTTIVAASLLRRHAIGIDISDDAINIANRTLKNPIKSESNLLEKGRGAYIGTDQDVLALLQGISFVPVQRNKGIDAILRDDVSGHPILVRVQRSYETILDAAHCLSKAARNKSASLLFLIATHEDGMLFNTLELPPGIVIIEAPSLVMQKAMSRAKQGNMHSSAFL